MEIIILSAATPGLQQLSLNSKQIILFVGINIDNNEGV